MTDLRLNEEEIFQVACDLASEEARNAYLKQVCGDDEQLKERVLTLLRADQQHRNLEVTAECRSDQPKVSVANKIIGPYKILQWDNVFPVETNQVPLFKDLPNPQNERRLVNRGHLLLGKEVAPRMDDWLKDVFEQGASNDKAESTPSADEADNGGREPKK